MVMNTSQNTATIEENLFPVGVSHICVTPQAQVPSFLNVFLH